MLNDVSHKIVVFVRDLCKTHDLDQTVNVVVSLNRFDELSIENRLDSSFSRKTVCGYYEPGEKLIVLSLPCIIEKGNLSETLARELIHHCQYTCRQDLCRNLCRVLLNVEEGKRISIAIPYNTRPHEFEAYSKQEELAEKLKELEGYKDIENIIKRLHFTLNLSLSFDKIDKNIKLNFMYSPTYSHFSHILSTYVSNFGTDTLIDTLKQHVEKYYGGLVEEVRKCIEHEAKDLLNLLNIEKYCSRMRIVEDLAHILSELYPRNPAEFLKKLSIKFAILTPGRNSLDIYIATNHGYTLHIDTYLEHPPLTSLKIKFNNTKTVDLYEIINSSKIDVKMLSGMVQIRLSKDKVVEAKVIPKKDINAVDEVRKLCNKLGKPLYTESLDLIALLHLLDFNLLNTQSLKLEKPDDSHIKIQYIADTKTRELFMCSNIRIYVGNGVRKEISIREALEKIITRSKDFF